MTRFFKRTVELSVARPGEIAVAIRDLRMTFDIQKSTSKDPNKAVVKVFNLSKKTRDLFEEKDVKIQFMAGYDGVAKTIFTGNVTFAESIRSGTDIITSVESGDGQKAYQESYVNQSFAPSTDIFKIIKSVADTLIPNGIENVGQALNQIKPKLLGLLKQSSTVVSGSSQEILDRLLKDNGLEFSIQQNTLKIVTSGQASVEEVFLLSPTTGLIGFPERLRRDPKDADDKTDPVGVRFRSLLIPDLAPLRLVKIESQATTGNFRIEKCQHVGDNHQGEFVTVCEASLI